MRRTDRFRRVRSAALLALASTLCPGTVAGQGWDVPRLLGPHTPVDRAALWTQHGNGQGGGDGLLVLWRPRSWSPRVSLRAQGVVGGAADRIAGGVDLRVPLAVDAVAVTWNTGLGLSLSEAVSSVSVPLQLAVSRSISEGQIWLGPWFATGLALDWRPSPPEGADDFEVFGVAEVGLDLAFDTRRRYVLRLGWSFWERDAFALGLALPY